MLNRVHVCGLMLCLYVLACAPIALADTNAILKTAPALPAPSGPVTHVYNITDFYSAVSNAGSGTTVMIHPGTYQLTNSVPQLQHSGVTFRGFTGNRDDVVIVGGGMNNPTSNVAQYGFQVNVNNITIADLTIRDVYYHGIQIRGENSVTNVLIHNVKILNAGERFIKGSTATGKIASNVTIEYCWLEQILDFVSRPGNSVDPDNYIGGIDAIGLNNWQIHDCYIKRIRGLTGGGRGGIFLWGGVTNSIAERNCVIGCDRDIAFGNPFRDASVAYHSTNCIIRNNFVVRGASYALELCASNNMKAYNNTIYSDNSGANAIHVEDGVTTGLKLYSNIIRGQVFLNNGAGTVTADTTGSIIGNTAQPNWFVDPTNGDLRLTTAATPAIGQGQALPEVTDDFFATPRNSPPDVGAYELPATLRVSAFTPAVGQVLSKASPVNRVTITFSQDVFISGIMVSVAGKGTGSHNDFSFSYDSPSHTATLQWTLGLPNDTYIVTVSSAVQSVTGGLGLDGEMNLANPVLPSGNGFAGGDFTGPFYRLIGDINGDRYVNVGDLLILVASWGKTLGDTGYRSEADLDANNSVNIADLQLLVANWGLSVPAAN